MKRGPCDITSQDISINDFQFDQRDNALIIKAQTDEILYCAEFQPNSCVSFDSLKDSLQSGKFKIVSQNNQMMKLKVSKVIDLEFVNNEKVVIDELRHSILKLNKKIQTQITKNEQLSQTTANQQFQIQKLKENVSNLNDIVENFLLTTESLNEELKKFHAEARLHRTQTNDSLQEISQDITSFKDTVQKDLAQTQDQITASRQIFEKHQTKQQKKNNKNALKMEQYSAELTKRTTRHDRLKKSLSQFIDQNNKNELLQQSANQQTDQDITNLTAQLAWLRTQFNQLLNQTIPKFLTSDHAFLHDSKIVCSDGEKSTLRMFFAKPIKQGKLLYRASDDEFCAKKFHEKCDGIADTLTVVWTEFDRKIGAFTPLKWSSQNAYATDNSKESFIFSLTHNDKFTLQKPENAIYNCQICGPKFGGGYDLRVCDKANSQNRSRANICCSYHNDKYKHGDKASWERFHGGSTGSCNFKTKEWEVWGVEWA